MSESGAGRIRIERATPADAVALARLASEALPEPWSEAGFAAEIAAPHARVWVARGPAGAPPLAYLVAHCVLDELQVLSLAVAAAHRRRGVGRALLEHALTHDASAVAAHLEVRSNDAGAQAFYQRLRFAIVGRRPGFYPGGIDAISMTRTLKPTVRTEPPG